MRTLLLGSLTACIASLIVSGSWRRYPVLCFLLGFQWLGVWLFSLNGEQYEWTAGPALVFRFAATLEVSHQQTCRFRYWSGLIAGSALLAIFYTASVWNGPIENFTAGRRMLHIWCAAFFLVLQVFWIVQRFWYLNLSNSVAVWFCLSLLNHASVSLEGLMRSWTWLIWWDVMEWSWRAEAFCWFGLAITVLCLSDRDGVRSPAVRS